MAFYGIFAALCINDVNFFIFYSIDVNVHTSHFSGGGFCVMNFLKRSFRKRQFLFFKTLFYPVSPWSDGRKTNQKSYTLRLKLPVGNSDDFSKNLRIEKN